MIHGAKEKENEAYLILMLILLDTALSDTAGKCSRSVIIAKG